MVFLFCFFLLIDRFKYEQSQYNDLKEEYDSIVYFWKVWDANEDLHRHAIHSLLDSDKGAGVPLINDNGETVYVKADKVFPGVHEDMLDMSSFDLDVKAKAAKQKAIQQAGKKVVKPVIVDWFLALSLGAGAIGISLIWLLFFIIRWLVRCFCSDSQKTSINNKHIETSSDNRYNGGIK
ncbi:MAG: hypothetical protein GWN67_21550 [Phycisphaerae bacterium]|nr:hypothetical protein [Phycisphaerae bacterium]NIU09712.1 hypothetical protein [Phycisphaerae bacterium]NIU58868.1 hypothetical protein [Phycisphaerae bacterium]NIW95134.1 hypothetical protein [Phycisphaerae bacterium]NIW98296.1 hypothetical protein [Phycisphaerae bacterium]